MTTETLVHAPAAPAFPALPRILRGAPVAAAIKERVVREVNRYKALGIVPRMATVLAEGDAASVFYAQQKARIGRKLGIEVDIVEVGSDITQLNLARTVQRLCRNPDIHGVMLELPLPRQIDADAIIAELSPEKDVDGLTDANRMANIAGLPGIYPATPLACLALLAFYGIQLKGCEVTLVGCGKTVGSPLLHGLIRAGATVTVCTEHTRDLASHLQHADVAVVAVGCAGLIQPEMVHDRLVLIDAGMSELADGRMAGDVHPDVADDAAAMTPTPGGVGTVTTAQLFANLVAAMSLQVPAPLQASTRL